jgi:hypothetical protein
MTNKIHDPVHRTSHRFQREGANLWVETVITSPPPALQRIVLPFLSRFAR